MYNRSVCSSKYSRFVHAVCNRAAHSVLQSCRASERALHHFQVIADDSLIVRPKNAYQQNWNSILMLLCYAYDCTTLTNIYHYINGINLISRRQVNIYEHHRRKRERTKNNVHFNDMSINKTYAFYVRSAHLHVKIF